jgi:4-amino-4-deoxy-L-arabinose transferase-like glycosyltransferase
MAISNDNKTQTLKKSSFHWIIVLAIILFIIFKVPYLNLPFYWDEAWVYGPAVRTMEQSGPCLLPGCISQWLHTGHPLLFYFSASLWMKVFGASCYSGHVFSLFISILTLGSFYYIGCKLLNKKVALLSGLLLMTTPIFAAQSGIMVPEIFLTLFTIWSIYFYYKKKFFLYFLTAICAVYVKESGLVLVCAVALHSILFNPYKLNLKGRVLYSLAFFSPFFISSIFYILQYFISGYFFFPRHLNWVDFSMESIFNKLNGELHFVALAQGRNIISFISLISILILFFIKQKRKLLIEKKELMTLFLIFLFGFFLFCSLNFLSTRYMLSMIPFYFLICSFIIVTIFNKWMYFPIILILLSINIFSLYDNTLKAFPQDYSLAYKDMVDVHQEAVNYLIENKLHNKKIITHGLLNTALIDPYAGYISKENSKKFTSINKVPTLKAEIVITSIMEQDEKFKAYKLENLSPIKEFKKGNGWCKIYIWQPQ